MIPFFLILSAKIMEIFDICTVLVKKMFWIIAEAPMLFVYPLLLMLCWTNSCIWCNGFLTLFSNLYVILRRKSKLLVRRWKQNNKMFWYKPVSSPCEIGFVDHRKYLRLPMKVLTMVIEAIYVFFQCRLRWLMESSSIACWVVSVNLTSRLR